MKSTGPASPHPSSSRWALDPDAAPGQGSRLDVDTDVDTDVDVDVDMMTFLPCLLLR